MIGRLHPDFIGREQSQVSGDVACVWLACVVVLTLLLLSVPPEEHQDKEIREIQRDRERKKEGREGKYREGER